MSYETVPANLSSLNQRCNNLEKNDQLSVTRRQNQMALVVVGQMLPGGVAKGGSAMAMRYGEAARFTSDFDASRRLTEAEFTEAFAMNLEEGWCGFTGVLKERPKPAPRGVPAEYVMVPYDIKLRFKGKSWKTVKFELGPDEIGASDVEEQAMSDDLKELFTTLGFPAPDPVKVLRAENQIAQKIHAATAAGSERAHDLVDLQLLDANEDIDYALVKRLCVRTFAHRRAHAWPPELVPGEAWETVYRAAAEEVSAGSNVRELADAIVWAEGLIHKIDNA